LGQKRLHAGKRRMQGKESWNMETKSLKVEEVTNKGGEKAWGRLTPQTGETKEE